MCWFARLAISVMVTLMTIAATVEQARAQRLRGPEPWAYERYASNKVKPLLPASKLSDWNATLKEWDIRDTFCLANVDPEVTPLGDTISIGLKRPPDAPNYDMNYENVVFMGAGRFYGDEDTTLNGETTFTTPIPSIVLLQHGRLGHGAVGDETEFKSNVRVLQIFTVESRPFRVLDPLNFNHLEGQRYRRDTTEGLGVVLNAQGRVVSSKYNIMVDSAQTQHPTVLRYDDRSLDATRVRGVAVADLTGDVRDEVVLFYDSGTDTRVIRLSNDSALGHRKPMDYIFTRHNDATVAYATLDVRDLRHAVAGRFIVGTDTVRQVVLFLRDANNAQRIVVARPGTPWTFTEVATPLTTVLDVDALDGVVRTDLDGDGVDEITFVERRNGSTDVGRIVSGATWTVAAAADRYTLSPQVAAAGRVTAVGGGDVDGDGADEVVLASRRSNSSNDATLVVVRRQGTAWSDTTSVRADGAHLDGTHLRRLVVANLDYDVRRRGDVAVLYHGDPSASERDDRLLLWRSLPRHADNDYTLDVDTGQGRQPFIPLGWFGIRLSTGLTPRPTPDVIHLTDNWRKLHVWWGPEDQQRRSGYRYVPDSGRIGDALLQDYASIYNTIISERQDYTDGYMFAGRNNSVLDAGSTLYYHNLNECRDGLLETIDRANNHNLMVMPYMGFHLPHTYDLRNDSTRQWHSWRTTQAGAAAGTLPQFSRTLMDPAVQNHRRFLGWYGADEPTGLLYNTHWTEFQREFSPGLLPPAPPRATLRDTLRAFYRSVRWRSIDHPVFMNYHMPLDYEYYRNCHDVAMVDCYVHRAQYEITYQTASGVERISNRRRTDTDPPAPAAEGVQWSLNPRMRGLMQHVIRTDKVAAIHIGQGVGEDYTGVDVDHSTNPQSTLRVYPEYRNLTHDEARYLLFAPAALGI